jgi:hypothetical protein
MCACVLSLLNVFLLYLLTLDCPFPSNKYALGGLIIAIYVFSGIYYMIFLSYDAGEKNSFECKKMKMT